MPSNTTPSNETYDNYHWTPGMNARFDSALVRCDPDGRVAIGARGWDSKHKGPGFVQVEMTTAGLQAFIAQAQAALALKRLKPASDKPRVRAA